MAKTKKEKFMALAIEVARANPVDNLQKMGAIVVKQGKVIGVGVNQKRSDPFQKRFGKNSLCIYIHAEISAIKNSLKNTDGNLNGSSIYIARIKKDGSTGLAKPCPGCRGALAHFGIDSAFWTE